MDWQHEVNGSHQADTGSTRLIIDKAANPQAILEIQPTSILIRRPFKNEDLAYLRHLERLTYLKAYDSGLFNNIEAETACLAGLKALEVEDLYDNITEASAMAFGRSLVHFTQLTALRMKCMEFSVVLPALAAFIGQLTGLQYLDLIDLLALETKGMKEVASHLSKLTHLRHLGLSGLVNGHDEASVQALCQILQVVPHLTCLRLPWSGDVPTNGFNPEAIVKLCSPISQMSGLTHLDLSGSFLDESSMKALGEVLAHLPLIHLILDGTRWDMSGFEVLLTQFEKWAHLKALRLSNVGLNDEKATLLSAYLNKLTSLILLDLQGYRTGQSLSILLPALTQLPLQALYLQATRENESILQEAFPDKNIVIAFSECLIHDPTLPTWEKYTDYASKLVNTEPPIETL